MTVLQEVGRDVEDGRVLDVEVAFLTQVLRDFADDGEEKS